MAPDTDTLQQGMRFKRNICPFWTTLLSGSLWKHRPITAGTLRLSNTMLFNMTCYRTCVKYDTKCAHYLLQYNGEFDWSRQTQGNILSSFFWGYVCTQILGGWLARKYGGKRVIFLGVMLAAICTFLSPPAARLSPYALMVMRIINGFGQVNWRVLLSMFGQIQMLVKVNQSAIIRSQCWGYVYMCNASGIKCEALVVTWMFSALRIREQCGNGFMWL